MLVFIVFEAVQASFKGLVFISLRRFRVLLFY